MKSRMPHSLAIITATTAKVNSKCHHSRAKLIIKFITITNCLPITTTIILIRVISKSCQNPKIDSINQTPASSKPIRQKVATIMLILPSNYSNKTNQHQITKNSVDLQDLRIKIEMCTRHTIKQCTRAALSLQLVVAAHRIEATLAPQTRVIASPAQPSSSARPAPTIRTIAIRMRTLPAPNWTQVAHLMPQNSLIVITIITTVVAPSSLHRQLLNKTISTLRTWRQSRPDQAIIGHIHSLMPKTTSSNKTWQRMSFFNRKWKVTRPITMRTPTHAPTVTNSKPVVASHPLCNSNSRTTRSINWRVGNK